VGPHRRIERVDDGEAVYFQDEDILATDWETEPAPVTVTREQWESARDEAIRLCARPDCNIVIHTMARRLGLE